MLMKTIRNNNLFVNLGLAQSPSQSHFLMVTTPHGTAVRRLRGNTVAAARLKLVRAAYRQCGASAQTQPAGMRAAARVWASGGSVWVEA